MRDDELLSAYADGVAELAPDERKQVESLLAADPARRGELESARSLLRDLRALPHDGVEPDWQAMERAIRAAVPAKAPRRWWRWAVPAMAFAAVAALVLVLLPRTDDVSIVSPYEVVKTDAGVRVEPKVEQHTFVYLGDEAIDLGAVDAKQVVDALGDDEDDPSDVADGDLLAVPDLHWVDKLDTDKLDRIEKLLQQGT
jgi:anti-sigma factor RsiW